MTDFTNAGQHRPLLGARGSATSPLTPRAAKFRVLDLFAGIGGFSLGLERTGGFEAAAFCEIEPYPQRVLQKHWPKVPIYDDIKELTAAKLAADGIAVDVITAGWPCQDISLAGEGAGLGGERSGLFYEVARLIGELGPKYVIMENVAALLGRGLADVLGTLASLGYDAEWHCIPASHVGAPHRRDRIWIIAYRRSVGPQGVSETGPERGATGRVGGKHTGLGVMPVLRRLPMPAPRFARMGVRLPCSRRERMRRVEYGPLFGSDWWPAFTEPVRVAHGLPDRSHRLKALGNAVVSQIPELIGRAILQSETIK